MDEYDIELIHYGFEIHTELPQEGILLTDYIPNAYEMLEKLNERGKEFGLIYNNVRIMPNTHKALVLGEYMKTLGLGQEYSSLTYKAYFEDGVDLGDTRELVKIANKLNITEETVDHILTSKEFEAILHENIAFCKRHQITSVPTFIINDEYAIVGAQTTHTFHRIFEQLKNEQGE